MSTTPVIKTKVVVRRLPPNLPEETFNKSIEPYKHSIIWQSYLKGKLQTNKAKVDVFSTCNLQFDNTDNLLKFYNDYNNHVFVDSKGVENKVLVELALYQKVPKLSKKADSRCNTIDKDEDYIKFLEQLKNPEADNKMNAESNSLNETGSRQNSNSLGGETELQKLERKLLDSQKNNQLLSQQQLSIKSTPLLEQLKLKKLKLKQEQKTKKRDSNRQSSKLILSAARDKGISIKKNFSTETKKDQKKTLKVKSNVTVLKKKKDDEKSPKKVNESKTSKSAASESPSSSGIKVVISKKSGKESSFTVNN
ncbi:hypothetical protein HK099_005640 [Clydaea vesicula]|uniref:UPF3 domain-containing protein n=1 Tax=Clydaea vesicula TaxID=447962 RepID=A0AAD5U6D1_9FUNG|nr:hypothetical protein HK099_005640 [Clydaea vesicula]KAJ3390951.1 hypothetical protein HDU92_000203 [Lobulomyces angularis]